MCFFVGVLFLFVCTLLFLSSVRVYLSIVCFWGIKLALPQFGESLMQLILSILFFFLLSFCYFIITLNNDNSARKKSARANPPLQSQTAIFTFSSLILPQHSETTSTATSTSTPINCTISISPPCPHNSAPMLHEAIEDHPDQEQLGKKLRSTPKTPSGTSRNFKLRNSETRSSRPKSVDCTTFGSGHFHHHNPRRRKYNRIEGVG